MSNFDNTYSEGLILNNKFYKNEELAIFCSEVILHGELPQWQHGIYQFILDFLDDKDFIIQQTSGTTGKKKSLKLSKKSMLSSAKLTSEFFRLKPGDSALLCLPIEYIAGKMMVVRSLVAGMNLILTEPSGTPQWEELDNIDFCAMVPLQVNNLLKTDALKKIETLIIGGAEISKELENKLQDCSNNIYETYGMAETCSHIALKRINGESSDNYFKALPGVSLELDLRGCLVIDAPFLEERVITNDLVEISESGFRWLGRYDNVINTGGIKVQPEVLEKQIEEIINLPCAIVGLPDPVLGQKIVLFVESIKELEKDILIESLQKGMDKKMIPKEIYFIEKLPRNKSFKFDRKELIKLKHPIF